MKKPKRFDHYVNTRQWTIIPTVAILDTRNYSYDSIRFKYRIAFGFLCFLCSVGIFKKKPEKLEEDYNA